MYQLFECGCLVFMFWVFWLSFLSISSNMCVRRAVFGVGLDVWWAYRSIRDRTTLSLCLLLIRCSSVDEDDSHQRSLSNICSDRVTRSSFRHASRNSSMVITPSWLRSSFRKTLSTWLPLNIIIKDFDLRCTLIACNSYLVTTFSVVFGLVRSSPH